MGEAENLRVHSWAIKDVSLPRTVMEVGVGGENLETLGVNPENKLSFWESWSISVKGER